ncbi:MAG: SulP family inorganic anion transporter, partial [Chloroflexota bacterium]
MIQGNAGQIEEVNEPTTFGRLWPSILNGTTIGLLEALWWVSLLALIFSGPLSVYIGRATFFIVAGSFVSTVFIAYRSSWRGSISVPQDVPTAILVVATGRIIVGIGETASADAVFVTSIATIGIASIAMGLFMYFLGVFKLGNLVRFLPFPVTAGFLAGTGWLLLIGGFSSSIASGQISDLLLPESIIFWLPTLAISIITYFIEKRFDSPVVLPIMLVVATAIFYGVTLGQGYTLPQLTEAGWLVGELPAGFQPQIPNLADFRLVQWGAIVAEAGSLAVLVVASAVAMLLNNSGFELTVNKDFDPNSDLRAHGVANTMAGFVGGWPSYITPAWSSINSRDKKEHPLAGLIIPIVGGLLLWYATQLFAYLPRFVLGATVSYLGMMFLIEWALEPARRLPRLEYGILLAILGVIAFFGLLEGVAVGLVLAVILFVVNYSRINVLRYSMSGLHQQSRVTRTQEHREFLRSVGHQTQILQLQGYIFFGSANRLLDKVRKVVSEEEIEYLVLDFERVTGIDSTAVLSISKLQKFLALRNITLMISEISSDACCVIEKELPADVAADLQIFGNVDMALQAIEEQQLIDAGFDPQTPVPTFK